MKILVLMPLDEKWSYIATALWEHLDAKIKKENAFAMNMFSEWQIHTKKMIIGPDVPVHWNVATLGSIIKAKEMYQLNDKLKKDFILIGNINPEYKFDLIVNFQDLNEDLPYEDKYIEKLREVFKDTPEVMKLLNMYEAKDSTMTLHNITAAAAFLSAYLGTDPHLDEIKEKYKEILNFKGEPHESK